MRTNNVTLKCVLYGLVGFNILFVMVTMAAIFDRLPTVRLFMFNRGNQPVSRKLVTAAPSPDNVEGFDPIIKEPVPTWSELQDKLNGTVKYGGRPKDARFFQKMVIIVPYRDRLVHLKLFLAHMHPFLQKQGLDYVIYVVEMEQSGNFRKTVIMNAGFLEVTKRERTSCIIFHDVDMLPVNDENRYYCDANSIRHLASAIKQFNYSLLYSVYIGGAIAFPTKFFVQVNGYSNLYSGWGGEDDDMYFRIQAQQIKLNRQDLTVGRYRSWPHVRQQTLLNRIEYIRTAVERMKQDGLNSVNYTIDKLEERPLFTWILIRTHHTDDSYKDITPSYLLDLKLHGT